MPTLYGLKILMQFSKLLYYKKSHQNNIISASKLSLKSFFFQKNNFLTRLIYNVLFISKALNSMLSSIFKNWFQFSYKIHHYSTTSSMKDHLHKKSFRMDNSKKICVNVSAIDSWNKMQDQMGEIALKDLRPNEIK